MWCKLLFILLLVSIHCQDDTQKQETPSIKLDQNTTINLKANVTQRYELAELDLRQGKLWNLFFIAQPMKGSQWEDLDIHIYRKNGDTLVKILGCEDIGVDTCVLQSQQFRSDDKLVIEFKCMEEKSECNYSFKMYWSETYPMLVNRGLRIDFENEAYAKTFSLDLTNQTFKQLRILLRAESFLAGTSPIKMVANFGSKTPQFNNYDIASTHLWDDGQGIFLSSSDMVKPKLTILIQGPAQNVLKLDAILINQFNNNLTYDTPIYDFLKLQDKRSYVVNVSQKSIQNNDIIIKISTFSGRLNVTFYQDKQFKNRIMGGQFSHHGQLQHRFPRKHLNTQNVKQNLYVLIDSPYYDSTFVLVAFARNDTINKLSNDIEDMSQVNSGQIVNYYVDTYLKTNHTEGKQLTFSIHNLVGQVKPYFSFCDEQKAQDCTIDYRTFNQSPTRYDTIIPLQITNTGTSTIYRIHINSKQFNKSTPYDNFKKATLLILFTSENESLKQFSIRYIGERVKILRDNHPLKERILMGQTRVYRSANIQDDVEKVIIRLVQISGIAKMFASNKNPLVQTVPLNQSIIPLKNQIIYEFKNNRKRSDPLFISVNGEESSLYSIVLTFYRNQTYSPSPDKEDRFTFITIPQNVEQELTLQPETDMAIKLQTNRKNYTFIYYSSYPLQLCLRNNSTKFPRDPACDYKITQNYYTLPLNPEVFIGIHNPSKKIATIRVRYTLDQQESCQTERLGDVWRRNVTQSKIACVTYKITKKQRVDVIISLDKLNLKQSKFTATLNTNSISFNKTHFIITEQIIQQNCPDLFKCDLTLKFENMSGSHIQVIAQVPNKQIILLDGLAQIVYSPASPTVPKYFKYYLVNKINTTFFLESKKGYFEFYVNIVSVADIEYNWTKLYPMKGAAAFSSEGSRYTIYNQLSITKQQIDNMTCESCVALITVVGAKDQYKQIGQFVIQVTQEARVLSEHSSALGYLNKQSFAFYQYYFPKDNGTLIVSLSTENIQCGRIFISKGNLQKASGTNYLNKSESGQLIYNAQKGLYSITVEAVGQHCQYIISASSSSFKLYELKPGVYRDIELNNGEVAYFFYHHISNTPFKVMSISKSGSAVIYAKQSNIKQIEYLEENKIEKSEFILDQSIDILAVYTNTPGYKQNALYLIAVEAVGLLDSSILLYNGQVEIPLSNDDIVADKLKSGQFMTYKTYPGNAKQINVSLSVYHGQVKVTIVELNESKIFKQNKQNQIWSTLLKRQFSYGAAVVKIEALSDTYYSINLKFNYTQGQAMKIKKGLPLYMFFNDKQSKCITGEYENQNQTLVASVYKTLAKKLQGLVITTKVNNISVKTISNIVENTMVISFNQKVQTNLTLSTVEYCIQNTQGYTSLTLVSASIIAYLPESTVMPVRTQGNFTLYLTGHVWIEVLECEGTSSLLLSIQFNKMGQSQSQIMFWRKFGNNYIMQVQHYGLVYMNVEGKHSLVRWGKINKNTGEGMGYYAIKMPDYNYILRQSNITFKIPPVQRLNRATGSQDFLSKQNFGTFYLIISASSKQLKKSVQCSQGESYVQTKTFQKLTWQSSFQFVIQMSKLKQIYPNEKYLYIGGALELNVKINSDITQTYRFMIESQQIPWTRAYEDQDSDQKDKQSIVEQIKKTSSYLWVILIIVVLIAIICIGRSLYKRHLLKRTLLSNDNTGSLQMRYSEHSVS